MGADASQDLPASRSSAAALPVDRIATTRLPAPLAPDPAAERRVIEFFTTHIRNPHTRNASAQAAGGFAAWAERHGIAHLREVEPVHVAAYVKELQGRVAEPPETRVVEKAAAQTRLSFQDCLGARYFTIFKVKTGTFRYFWQPDRP